MGQGEFRLNLMCNLLTEIVQRAQKRAFCKVTRLTFCRCVAVLCSKAFWIPPGPCAASPCSLIFGCSAASSKAVFGERASRTRLTERVNEERRARARATAYSAATAKFLAAAFPATTACHFIIIHHHHLHHLLYLVTAKDSIASSSTLELHLNLPQSSSGHLSGSIAPDRDILSIDFETPRTEFPSAPYCITSSCFLPRETRSTFRR